MNMGKRHGKVLPVDLAETRQLTGTVHDLKYFFRAVLAEGHAHFV